MVIPRKCKKGMMQVGCRCKCVISESECLLLVICALAGVLLQGPYCVGLIRVLPPYRSCLRILAPSARIVASKLNFYNSDSPQRPSGGSPRTLCFSHFFNFLTPPFFLFLIYSLALILFENNYLQLSLRIGQQLTDCFQWGRLLLSYVVQIYLSLVNVSV